MTIPVSADSSDADAAIDAETTNLLTLCLAAQQTCTQLCMHVVPAQPGTFQLKQCQLARLDAGFAVHVVYTRSCG